MLSSYFFYFVLVAILALCHSLSVNFKSGCTDCAKNNPNCVTEVSADVTPDEFLTAATCSIKPDPTPLIQSNRPIISSGFLQASFFNSECFVTDLNYGFIINLGVCTKGRDPLKDGDFSSSHLIPLNDGSFSFQRFRFSDSSCTTQSLPPVIIRRKLQLGDFCECDCIEGSNVNFKYFELEAPTFPTTSVVDGSDLKVSMFE